MFLPPVSQLNLHCHPAWQRGYNDHNDGITAPVSHPDYLSKIAYDAGVAAAKRLETEEVQP